MDVQKVSLRFAPTEGNLVVNDIRWMEPNEGEHTLCWTGMDERYQTYSFTGSKTIMGVGSTSPEEFTGDATWDTGSSQVGGPNLRVNRMVLG